jgi:hypothetical protein
MLVRSGKFAFCSLIFMAAAIARASIYVAMIAAVERVEEPPAAQTNFGKARHRSPLHDRSVRSLLPLSAPACPARA